MTEQVVDVFPSSSGQERMWFLARFEPELAVYNIGMLMPMSARQPVDPRRLEAAVAHVVRRHEVLRTVFEFRDGQVVQIVSGAVPPVRLTETDLTHLPADLREAELARLAKSDSVTPFVLDRAPLWRLRQVRMADDDLRLICVFDHTVFDGVSSHIFVNELEECYDAIGEGREPKLAELPIQFADFAVWQRDRLTGKFVKEELAHWRERLAGIPSDLALPADRPRPRSRSYRGEMQLGAFSPEVSAGIQRLAKDLNSTLFTVMLTAFATVLSRWSGQYDVVVGTPIAGRLLPETEPVIGMFVNAVALRADLTGDPTFAEAAGRVRTTVAEALDHQELPFERLVEALQPTRDLSVPPIYQVMFNLAGDTNEGQIANGTAKVDLQLDLNMRGGRLHTRLEYSTDLFDPSTIERFGACLETLVEAAVADPGTPISRLPLLTPAERDRVVALGVGEDPGRAVHLLGGPAGVTDPAGARDVGGAGRGDTRDVGGAEGIVARDVGGAAGAGTTPAPASSPTSLTSLIEAQVARTPDAPAVVTGDATLTYAELDERATRLAHWLRGIGVGRGSPVAVCAERSAELVVGLLAVLKAGGAYVPLDPEYPPSRLAFMLADSGARVMLTQRHLRDLLPEGAVKPVLLDAPDTWGSQPPGTALPVAGPDDAAYVIYTSGSTGRPKGVVNTHGGIVNRLAWMQDRFGLTPAEAVLQKTPTSFDVSVWEFFWPLVTGASLVPVRPGGHRDPNHQRDLIKAHSVSTAHFVPSMLALFLEETGIESCRSLKRVICSGEELPPHLAARFFERLPGVELHNLYGPTEAAVDVTAWRVEPEGAGTRHTLPIGPPMPGNRLHVLDDLLQPAPVGVPGHLHIGGVQVARGYADRPGLTAERFVPDPYGPPGSRLYATGDLARVRADGSLEFLGRMDDQVKVHGWRVELGEIEAVIAEHPRVRRAVVALRDDAPGGRGLVGYVDWSGDASALTAELRRTLARKLPAALIPQAFVGIDDIPLGPSGKLDRGALPAPTGSGRADLGTPYTEPRTPLETELCALWGELLGRERIGVEDDFFQLGGHSLLAVLLVTRYRDTYGVEMPLRRCFEITTVTEHALAVLELQLGNDDEELAALLAALEDPADE
ncbi:non-ribosomal peptide synthetase [Streptosporangium sp. NBC_01469]|uniref:non-ribosomal peptide synthetase n=1 Tax=Streptosporangium sp. NBC_01469 TaxID=2903898 RepID=UPI002E2AFE14|nr:amino acid adenylation domain-containing protein [Streptosporangium sp. NBC_01469]